MPKARYLAHGTTYGARLPNMREVYIGKTIVLQNQKFKADEFYFVGAPLALAIVSSGCGVYADSEPNSNEGEDTNESNSNTQASY